MTTETVEINVKGVELRLIPFVKPEGVVYSIYRDNHMIGMVYRLKYARVDYQQEDHWFSKVGSIVVGPYDSQLEALESLIS